MEILIPTREAKPWWHLFRGSGKKKKKPPSKRSILLDAIPFLWSLSVLPASVFHIFWAQFFPALNSYFLVHCFAVCLVVSFQIAWIRMASWEGLFHRHSLAFIGMRAGWIVALTIGCLWILIAVLGHYKLWLTWQRPEPIEAVGEFSEQQKGSIRLTVMYSVLITPLTMTVCSLLCLFWERLFRWTRLATLWDLQANSRAVRAAKRIFRYALLIALLIWAGIFTYQFAVSKGWVTEAEQVLESSLDTVSEQYNSIQVLDDVASGPDPWKPDTKIRGELLEFIDRHLNHLREGSRDAFLDDFLTIPDSGLRASEPLSRIKGIEFFDNLTNKERRAFPSPTNIQVSQLSSQEPTFSVVLQYGEPELTSAGRSWDNASNLLIVFRKDSFRIYGGNYGKLHRKSQ